MKVFLEGILYNPSLLYIKVLVQKDIDNLLFSILINELHV